MELELCSRERIHFKADHSWKFEANEEGWSMRVEKNSYEVGLWKSIRNGSKIFKSKCYFIEGNKSRVNFWKDDVVKFHWKNPFRCYSL